MTKDLYIKNLILFSKNTFKYFLNLFFNNFNKDQIQYL